MIETWESIIHKVGQKNGSSKEAISGIRKIEGANGIPFEYTISNEGKRINYSNGERVIIDWNDSKKIWERSASEFGEIGWYEEKFDKTSGNVLHDYRLALKDYLAG